MSTLFSHFFTKINQITPQEHKFTEVLNSIALKPKMLYFRGKLPENVVKTDNLKVAEDGENASSGRPSGMPVRPPVVAIVGSRHSTKYGEEVAYKLAYELGRRGVIVVSGLAYGIDSIGHRGCLDAGGVTVAVLGNPIDEIQPSQHTPLAAEIVEKGGAIISEYAPDTPEYHDAPLAPGEYFDDFGKRQIDFKSSFLHRNRLIAGLSDAVVVVEAAVKSGSLNTAAHALGQNKDVWAVPGNITNPYSQGCNKLIRQGALPYTEPDDILRELFPEDYMAKARRTRKLVGDSEVETLILQALGRGLRSSDDIMAETHLPPEVFNQFITLLEIKSRVRALGMNNWALI